MTKKLAVPGTSGAQEDWKEMRRIVPRYARRTERRRAWFESNRDTMTAEEIVEWESLLAERDEILSEGRAAL